MNARGVGGGDEVILPSYTFVACLNAILMLGVLPVFIDTDRETFQIDARKIEMTGASPHWGINFSPILAKVKASRSSSQPHAPF